jgi:hypothetical protein
MPPDDHAPSPATPWWKDPPKLIPVLVGVLAIVISGSQVKKLLDRGPPKVSIEYILDVSSAMRGKIGHKHKLKAVVAEIVEHAKNRPNSATALRLSGGADCSTGYAPPTVGFKENNGDRIEARLRRVTAGGKSDFANALTQASSDLQSQERAAKAKSKTLFLFVGGGDTCTGRRSERKIRQALRDLKAQTNIEINFQFVGVKASRKLKRLLRAAKRQANRLHFDADVVLANKPEDLPSTVATPSPAEDEYPPP